MRLIRKIVIEQMLREIKLSDKRNAKYYVLDPKKQPKDLPQKLQDKTKYDYLPIKMQRKSGTVIVETLCNLETGKRVVKNIKSVGTPKIIRINFQKLWDSTVSSSTRNNMAIAIKESYQSALSATSPITDGFPLKTNFTIHTSVPIDEEQDVDNLSMLYIKTFHDALTQSGIIPDDKLKYIKRFEAGHESADRDYIEVEIYSINE